MTSCADIHSQMACGANITCAGIRDRINDEWCPLTCGTCTPSSGPSPSPSPAPTPSPSPVASPSPSASPSPGGKDKDEDEEDKDEDEEDKDEDEEDKDEDEEDKDEDEDEDKDEDKDEDEEEPYYCEWFKDDCAKSWMQLKCPNFCSKNSNGTGTGGKKGGGKKGGGKKSKKDEPKVWSKIGETYTLKPDDGRATGHAAGPHHRRHR